MGFITDNKIYFLLFIILISCKPSDSNLLEKDSLFSQQKVTIPIAGARKMIFGDFNADGHLDTLKESFISLPDSSQGYKKYNSFCNYDSLVELVQKQNTACFLSSKNKAFSPLVIPSTSSFGLLYLHNEGDLNQLPGDEISYVVDWADWSNLNTYHIATLKDNHWQILFSFPIWEHQIEDLTDSESLVQKIGPSQFYYYFRNEEAILDTAIYKFN